MEASRAQPRVGHRQAPPGVKCTMQSVVQRTWWAGSGARGRGRRRVLGAGRRYEVRERSPVLAGLRVGSSPSSACSGGRAWVRAPLSTPVYGAFSLMTPSRNLPILPSDQASIELSTCTREGANEI